MTDVRPVRLYSPWQVFAAALLGSMLPAFWLISRNQLRAGLVKEARTSLVIGVVGTILLIVAGFVLAEHVPTSVLPIATAVSARQVAIQSNHQVRAALGLAEEAPAESWLRPLLAGAAGFVLVLVVIVAVVNLAPDSLLHRVRFSPADEIQYENGATAADAQRVGDALTGMGVFGHEGLTLRLDRTTAGFALSIAVSGPDVGAETEEAFRAVATQLSTDVFDGQPVEVRLCDPLWKVYRTLP